MRPVYFVTYVPVAQMTGLAGRDVRNMNGHSLLPLSPPSGGFRGPGARKAKYRIKRVSQKVMMD